MEYDDMGEEWRGFKGVYIKREIWLNQNISFLEKCLYAEIYSLSKNDNRCFASNKYFSKFFKVSERWIRVGLSNLKKEGLIEQAEFNGRKRILIALPDREEVQFRSDRNDQSGLFHIRDNKEEDVPSSSKKLKTTPDASKYHYLSELLISKIKMSGTAMKIIPEKIIPKWAQDFRLMVEQDKKTEKQIEKVIEAIFADEFWFKVIRSAGSLREKWITGKLDGLKDSQNAQEAQGPTKALTPWQELCRDSGDPGQRVFDRLIKIWEGIEGKEWMNYTFSPSDVKIMEPIFHIMQEFKGRSNVEMIEAVKKNLEGYKYAG